MEKFLVVTYAYAVYRCFINDIDRLVNKTYMTRFEGENTSLRHYEMIRVEENIFICPISSETIHETFASHRATLCYSKSLQMLKYSIKLLLSLF